MASYARNELGFKTEMTYALLASDVTGHWDWQGGRVQASAEDDLRVLLAYGPSFRLLIAHGYSDMITPYAMTRYILDHMPAFDPPGRVQLKLYRGGHMLYLDPESRKAFTADAARSTARQNKHASGDAATIEFEHIKTEVAIDDINQPTLIKHHIVALWRGTSAGGLGNKEANFARRRRDRQGRQRASLH